jgi:hypothetical protein
MSHETLRWHHVADERLNQALGSLPARIPPAGLTTSLRVIASRERKRFLERRTLPQAFATWYQKSNVTFGQMIRSIALPVTGGVFSAVVLFSTWLVPTYPLHAKGTFDVPIDFSTDASIQETTTTAALVTAGNALTSGDAVDMTVNDQGRVVDFSIVHAPGDSDGVRRHQAVENLLLYTRFAPATEFGKPASSKIRLLFSQVDVKD